MDVKLAGRKCLFLADDGKGEGGGGQHDPSLISD